MKFYFLTGIPRAGHTLFGSIMNQNPDIKVTANSLVMDMVRNMDEARHMDVFKNFPDHKSLDNIIENIYPNYYKDWNCKYVIDRNYLGLNLKYAPSKIELLKKAIKNEIKIIVLLRGILPVLQSLIKNVRENPFIPPFGSPKDIYKGYALPKDCSDESICATVASEHGLVHKSFMNVKFLYDSILKDNLHFIHYNDLVEDPQTAIDGAYKFLDIPIFKHRFENLSQYETNGIAYDDTYTEFGEKLHSVKDKLSLTEHNPLPKNIVEKYGNLNLLNGIN
jgi:hypothetical protein